MILLQYKISHNVSQFKKMYKNTNSPHVAQHRMGTVFFLVIQEGFEPPTHGLEGRCSIQLGYWTI